MKDDEFTLTGEMSPETSRATRGIPRRSTHSSRGGVVMQLPGQNRPRVVQFESKLEQRVLFLLLANPAVTNVWEQPQFISYRDQSGNRKTHFIDFLAELKNGRRLAIAVKPWKVVLEKNFCRELQQIRAAMRKDFADDIVLVTERDFTRAEALNAQRFVEFSKTRNSEHQAHLKSIICDVCFPVTVNELCQLLGLGGAGFRSIVIGIFEDILTADRKHLIDLDTLLSKGGAK
ncbi:MAG: Tn7 transposase TnsA N-terminal domain-containing protein [Ruegeria sp.]|uniref:Tn7 transposase TnsA N-terminal domain-containing protein n=1 Tax=Ruegeria sp. TaxID=1879320 RepID=UPI00349EE03D